MSGACREEALKVINSHHGGKILQEHYEQVLFELIEKLTLFQYFCIFASPQVFTVYIDELLKKATVALSK